MVDPATSKRWLYRAGFVLLCAVLIFLKMLPLNIEPGRLPGPDWVFAFTAAWIMRRPTYAPVVLIVLIHLITDLLFLRPPGLWAAVSLVAYEFLRRRRYDPIEITIPAEIFLVAVVFAVTSAAYSLFFVIFVIEQASVTSQILHVLTTIIAYPFAIAFTQFILQVTPVKPGDIDMDGTTA